MRRLALAAFLLALAPRAGRAEPPLDEGAAARVWHAGLSLRTDIGPHRVRVNGGGRIGRLELTVVVDPKVFIDTKESDNDLLVSWHLGDGSWAPLLGWRTSWVTIDRGRHWQEHVLAGLAGELPAFLGRRIRPRAGVEVVLTLVRHGAGFETDWASFASDRHIRDLMSVNLFLELDYERGW